METYHPNKGASRQQRREGRTKDNPHFSCCVCCPRNPNATIDLKLSMLQSWPRFLQGKALCSDSNLHGMALRLLLTTLPPMDASYYIFTVFFWIFIVASRATGALSKSLYVYMHWLCRRLQ